MTDVWHTFENTFGPLATDLPEKAVIPLAQSSLIEIEGEDANSFLQNLLTNDVEQLTNNQAQLTGLCNPKGRLITLFWLIKKQENQFIALLPSDTADILQKRLSMFVLRSKVTITNITAKHAAFAITSATDITQTINLSTKLKAKLVIIEQQQAIELTQQLLDEHYQLCAPSVWDILTISAGIPSVYEASSEAFTPQQINLDLVSGVSFQKGCYPGQEVVARLHYLGSPSRRLFLVQFQGKKLTPNQLVTDDEGNTVGHIVSSTDETTGQALASLKLTNAENSLSANEKPIKVIQVLADN